MENEVIALIDQEISRLKGLEESIRYVNRKQTELLRLRRELSKVKENLVPVDKAITETKRVATKYLEDELNIALQVNTEFAHPLFRNRILRAVRDPRTIEFRPISTKRALVKINLELTGGTLDDYAQAVDTARRSRQLGKYRNPPMSAELASHMWMEKYYQPAREGTMVPARRKARKSQQTRTQGYVKRYWQTIRDRFANMQSIASFWPILNYGTVAMSSDWGGSDYPQNTPTHFVEKAATRIQLSLDNSIQEQITKVSEIDNNLTKVNQALAYLESINFDSRNPREVLLEVIEQRLGTRFTNADQNKIMQLAEDILSGQEVSRRRIGGGERIRVLEIRSIISEFRRRTGR
jgi:hypothetical protein